MKAVENYYLTRIAITSYFMKKDITARFLPKLSSSTLNGSLVKLSLWKDGKNVSGDSNLPYMMSEVFSQFLAGILKHYPALIHFLAPSHNSVKRLR